MGIDGIESAATRTSLESLRLPVQHPDDFGKTLKAAARSRVEAVVVFEDIWLTKHRNDIAMLTATHALPVVSLYKDFAEAGGLFAYGASPTAVYRRTAYYVDRIRCWRGRIRCSSDGSARVRGRWSGDTRCEIVAEAQPPRVYQVGVIVLGGSHLFLPGPIPCPVALSIASADLKTHGDP